MAPSAGQYTPSRLHQRVSLSHDGLPWPRDLGRVKARAASAGIRATRPCGGCPSGRSLTAAEHSGNPAAIAEAWDLSFCVGYDRGDLAGAEECARRMLAISERIGEQVLSASAWDSLGRVA